MPIPVLMPEQAEVFGKLRTVLSRRVFEVHLLQGVPGSGKTEIYLALAAEVLKDGGSVLLLEPEIGIATQILSRVRARFGERAGLYHSQTGIRARRRTWEDARDGKLGIIVGARSAVFVPLPNLRLVIVDEEQEPAYKQEESPRYNGRDAAIVRARAAGALVVLGSATPSLEAWSNARSGKFGGHRLIHRYANRPAPEVRVVDLRQDPGLPPSGTPVPLFSGLLVQKVLDRLRRREQTILFLNRRGHSTIVQCSDCGEMFRCSRCDVVLTYHRTTGDLRCHHCGLVVKGAESCPACKGERLFYGGTGTQKLEERLAELFPQARLLRLDADSTRRRGSHADHLRAVEEGEIDILLGTQMVAKGFHFPRVTLVGVLQADREMGLPELRAAERAFHILTQVAGRAGRGETPGEVVFQTMLPRHYVIAAAAEGDFDRFAEEELLHRREPGLPSVLANGPHSLRRQGRGHGPASGRGRLRRSLLSVQASRRRPARSGADVSHETQGALSLASDIEGREQPGAPPARPARARIARPSRNDLHAGSRRCRSDPDPLSGDLTRSSPATY